MSDPTDGTHRPMPGTVPPPDHWFTAHNPPPAPAVYPPSINPPTGIRVSDPNVRALCLDHPEPVDLHLMSLDPDDIRLAYLLHDRLWHNPHGWLIGGPGGADGDVCNPCGGGARDKTPLVTVGPDGEEFTGPRHDLCLRGKTRGRGRDCPCQHDREYMRGLKPSTAVDRLRADTQRATQPDPTPPPVIDPPTAGYLFDPEDPDA
jgi:hypothetical protein